MQPYRGQHTERRLQMSWAHGVRPKNHHHPMIHSMLNHVSGKQSGTINKQTHIQIDGNQSKMGRLKAMSKCNKQQYLAVAQKNPKEKQWKLKRKTKEIKRNEYILRRRGGK